MRNWAPPEPSVPPKPSGVLMPAAGSRSCPASPTVENSRSPRRAGSCWTSRRGCRNGASSTRAPVPCYWRHNGSRRSRPDRTGPHDEGLDCRTRGSGFGKWPCLSGWFQGNSCDPMFCRSRDTAVVVSPSYAAARRTRSRSRRRETSSIRRVILKGEAKLLEMAASSARASGCGHAVPYTRGPYIDPEEKHPAQMAGQADGGNSRRRT